MKKTIVIAFLITFINPAFSQKYGEAGLFVGGSYFMGDVYSTVPEDLGLALGVSYRRNLNSRWAIRFDAKRLEFSGSDENSDDNFEIQRNQSFTNIAYSFGANIEFNFLNFKPYKPQSYFQNADVFTPFVSFGLSILTHNPKTTLAGNEYELRPLMTEGVSYSSVTVGLPMGFGFKFRLSDRFQMALIGELTPTFTDYLDDVSTKYPDDPNSLSKTGRDLSNRTLVAQGPEGSSWGTQRGNEINNDWLSSVVLSVSYNLRKNPSSCHFNTNK